MSKKFFGIPSDIKDIHTLADLEEAIKATEEAIHEIQIQCGYDWCNYVDFDAHLHNLQKLLRHTKNLEKAGALYCLRCESKNIKTDKHYNKEVNGYIFHTKCKDCGYIKTHIISKREIERNRGQYVDLDSY